RVALPVSDRVPGVGPAALARRDGPRGMRSAIEKNAAFGAAVVVVPEHHVGSLDDIEFHWRVADHSRDAVWLARCKGVSRLSFCRFLDQLTIFLLIFRCVGNVLDVGAGYGPKPRFALDRLRGPKDVNGVENRTNACAGWLHRAPETGHV